MYSNNREAYRQTFLMAWQKYQKQLPLTTLETQLVHVIQQHPEYQRLLNNPTDLNESFALEENPFFHMSLHMAIRDQIHLDRPPGIKSLYEKLLASASSHEAEHAMMQCLASMIWQAQDTGAMPSDEAYLQCLNNIKF